LRNNRVFSADLSQKHSRWKP